MNVNIRNENFETPLHAAVAVYGTYIYQMRFIVHFSKIIHFVYMRIEYAENTDYIAVVELLIKNCAALNVKTKIYEQTPLHLAAIYGN